MVFVNLRYSLDREGVYKMK